MWLVAEWLSCFAPSARKEFLGGFDPGVARSALTPGYYLERLRRTFALIAGRMPALPASRPLTQAVLTVTPARRLGSRRAGVGRVARHVRC